VVTRCDWAKDPLMAEYHDREWGVPVHDDRTLFEFLTLEGAQAGLSWLIILRKRENYRKAFLGFDIEKVANFRKVKIESLCGDAGIVRNRRKIESTVTNARATVEIRREFGSFSRYIRGLTGNRTIHNNWKSYREIPAKTDESIAMSKDLIRRGFKFVGPTICYAFMQAVGIVNDHEARCYRRRQVMDKDASSRPSGQ
jgi:DNA-3-methyladenine glycosylase I